MSYDPHTPRVVQTDDWSCSVASTAWLLRSLGRAVSYPWLETPMRQAGLVSPAQGLLVGNGGPLAAWLCTEYQLNAAHLGTVSWDWLTAVAGTRPVIIGGHGWYHWSGVRYATGDGVALANPADGWKGVGQLLTRDAFERLGPFSAVYCDVPGEEVEDMGQIEALTTRLGYIQGDVADALQQALDGLGVALASEDPPHTWTPEERAAYEALQSALNTLRNT